MTLPSTPTPSTASPIPVPTAAQVIAWTLGMAALSVILRVLFQG